MSFQELCFKSTPNFKWQEDISDRSESLSNSYNFDCYKDKTGNVILITPYFEIEKAYELDYHICFIDLATNKVIHTLGDKDSKEPQNKRVTCVRFFKNKVEDKDYFISADTAYKVRVWNLGNNPKECAKIFETDIKYEGFIYSCLLIFEPGKIYAVASSIGSNNHTKVFDINNGGNCKDLNTSNNLNVYYLDYWFNAKETDKNKQHVIIQAAKGKVIFTEFPSDTQYYSIDIGDDYPYIQSGLAFKQTQQNGEERDLFVFSATYGLVVCVDIAKKTEVKRIKMQMGEVHLFSFVKWNNQYLLLNDCQQARIIVFDMFNDFDDISKIVCPEMELHKFMRKIIHPKYGESLLSLGIDWKIKLFVPRTSFISSEKKE